MRIPGIGPTCAARILQQRRTHGLAAIEQLVRMGFDTRRAAPFVLLDGRAPAHQLLLFPL